MKYIKKIKIFLVASYILIFNCATARWAIEDDLSVKYDYYREEINVNADGTSETIIEYQATILKEQGRGQFAQLYFSYNEDSEELSVLEATTINNEKIYPLGKEMLEDKPLASSSNGFDQKRQVLLSFPNVEINSKIKLKLSYKTTKPILENEFSSRILDSNIYIKDLAIKLTSKIPLNIKINDPYKLLTITKDQPENFNNLAIHNIKPIHSVVLEEPASGVLNDDKRTWVSVSSITSWEKLGLKFAGDYYNVVNQPLPKLFKDIRTAATLVRGDFNRINMVTSLLNQKVQYMGDWRSIKGKLFPRSLATIANSQVGDCKDFSVSAAAILKQLGYKAQVALVVRGVTSLSLANLPGANNFNHAILKITSKEGTVYWIDPTNDVSMANGLFPDISDKNALILDLVKPSYEKIPTISPEHSKVLNQEYLEISGNTINHKGNIIIKGEQALNLTGAELYASKKEIENKIFYMLSGSYIEEDLDKSLDISDLSSRIVKDIELSYRYKKNNQLINTNLGFGIAIPNPIITDTIISANMEQISDLFLGPPVTKMRHITIKKINIKHIENLNYQIDTPWIYFNRECINNAENAEIRDTVIIKTMFIPNKDLKSNLYKQFKNDLERLVKDAILIM